MPDLDAAEDIHRSGHIYTPRPVAYSVGATPKMQEAVEFMEEKLTHALYLREVGTILTPDHTVASISEHAGSASTTARSAGERSVALRRLSRFICLSFLACAKLALWSLISMTGGCASFAQPPVGDQSFGLCGVKGWKKRYRR
jgi:hypothetical protein